MAAIKKPLFASSLLQLFLYTEILVAANTITYSNTGQARYTLRLPETAKYYPQDIDDLLRQYDASKNSGVKPVMKLPESGDEGQKYYDFESFVSFPSENFEGNLDFKDGKQFAPANLHDATASTHLGRAELGWTAWLKSPFGRLEKRQQLVCPAGNSPCTNIQQSGSCCPSGTTCVIIQDTGFGSVGCCPNGQVCGDQLSGCAAGYSQCPQSAGGGCCLPGYICSPQGCLINTSGITPPSTVVTVGTVTIGLDLCQNGYYPCPQSLNYGCCQVGYLCGYTDCPYNTGTGTPGIEYATSGFNIPSSAIVIQPTANGGSTTEGFSTINISTVRPATLPTATGQPGPKITNAPGQHITVAGGCPAGFSSCGAEFNGGCCRFGRVCGVSYCPVGTATTSAVQTITTITTNGACPGGWYQCPASVQGGCCPSAYGCGVYNCPAVITQDGVIVVITTAPAAQKVSPVGNPNGSGRIRGDGLSRAILVGWICCYVIVMAAFL
ncbi:hypothetical protein ABW19_dt0207887 [Dactylella cylindrospora]|nr:hypothetical protein ABW19_dt0207887 [Dactylella cylindrospora]